MKLGHKCWCKTEGHPWHNGDYCGQPVTRKLASGNVAKTCQTCFDANQLLRSIAWSTTSALARGNPWRSMVRTATPGRRNVLAHARTPKI